MKRKISIVICTCERPTSLKQTLISLNKLTIDNFEVIIVDASASVDTIAMIDCLPKKSTDYIRLIKIDVRNISVSRNLGIEMASCDIIAFLDDDAIPPSDWIEQLLSTYSFYGDKCAGVGGAVRDMTKSGFPLQYCRGITNIVSDTIPIRSSDAINYNQPQSFWYNGLMGANSSYRSDILKEINRELKSKE